MTWDVNQELPASARHLYLQAVVEAGLQMTEGELGDLRPNSPTRPDLELLLSLGLLRADELRGRLVPVDPESIVQQEERRAAEQSAALLGRAAAMREQMASLTSAYRTGPARQDQDSLIYYLSGGPAIGKQISHEVSQVRTRAWTVQPGGPRPGPELAATIASELQLLGRGVQRRILYQDPARYHPDTQTFVRQVTAAGAEVRTADFLPERFYVIDDVVIYPMGSRQTAVFAREPSIVARLVWEFEWLWERAIPYFDRPVPARAVQGEQAAEPRRWQLLTPEQQQVARLTIVNDLTADQASRLGGWSLRTINRHLKEIRRIYGANTQGTLGWMIRAEFMDGKLPDQDQ